ncbi:hypothetical protein T05_14241 [Trichinella murrelli]|uniref:Uncharacterized protein n=1 Tax=Trichinella murrelli TaxID=144512 RepID=A0A0V0TA38_9BILA|nr:hypothetical protein T05_14241 [Trichinella murrelli]
MVSYIGLLPSSKNILSCCRLSTLRFYLQLESATLLSRCLPWAPSPSLVPWYGFSRSKCTTSRSFPPPTFSTRYVFQSSFLWTWYGPSQYAPSFVFVGSCIHT